MRYTLLVLLLALELSAFSQDTFANHVSKFINTISIQVGVISGKAVTVDENEVITKGSRKLLSDDGIEIVDWMQILMKDPQRKVAILRFGYEKTLIQDDRYAVRTSFMVTADGTTVFGGTGMVSIVNFGSLLICREKELNDRLTECFDRDIKAFIELRHLK